MGCGATWSGKNIENRVERMKATGWQPAWWDACREAAYRMIRAVLLDVDGTLIDDNLLHVLAWTRAFRRLGREIDATTLLHAIGMGGDK